MMSSNPHIKTIKKEVSKFSKLLRLAGIDKKILVEEIYSEFYIIPSSEKLPTNIELLIGLSGIFGDYRNRNSFTSLCIRDIIDTIKSSRLSPLSCTTNETDKNNA